MWNDVQVEGNLNGHTDHKNKGSVVIQHIFKAAFYESLAFLHNKTGFKTRSTNIRPSYYSQKFF